MSVMSPISTVLPAAGSYTIDPTHSSIEFVARHLVAAKVRGRFTGFSGRIDVHSDPMTSSASVEIEVDTIDTGVLDRDAHLRSPDFFDVENHPIATFTTSAVRAADAGGFRLVGDLAIAGVTRPVELDLVYGGEVADPWGNSRLVFSATTELNREDFGLTWNQTLETGGLLVGKTVAIEIEIQAVRSDG